MKKKNIKLLLGTTYARGISSWSNSRRHETIYLTRIHKTNYACVNILRTSILDLNQYYQTCFRTSDLQKKRITTNYVFYWICYLRTIAQELVHLLSQGSAGIIPSTGPQLLSPGLGLCEQLALYGPHEQLFQKYAQLTVVLTDA